VDVIRHNGKNIKPILFSVMKVKRLGHDASDCAFGKPRWTGVGAIQARFKRCKIPTNYFPT
jgi:hypothetical protein